MISLALLERFSLDVAIVVAGALALVSVLRFRAPKVELLFCYAVLLTCLLLPLAIRSERIAGACPGASRACASMPMAISWLAPAGTAAAPAR